MNRTTGSTVLAAALVSSSLLLTACGSSDQAAPQETVTVTTPTPSPTETLSEAEQAFEETLRHNDENREKSARAGAEAASADPASTQTAQMSGVVGLSLDSAQKLLDAAGFRYVVDEDQTGQDRLQLRAREWIVCSQDPQPGTHRFEVLVTLNAVKNGETC